MLWSWVSGIKYQVSPHLIIAFIAFQELTGCRDRMSIPYIENNISFQSDWWPFFSSLDFLLGH